MPKELLPFEIEPKRPLKPMEAVPLEDIEELKYRLMRQFNIDMMENSAHALGVRDEKEAKYALSMALQSRKLEGTLEESRSEIVRPHVDYQRAINKLVKDFKDKLTAIETHLQGKITEWMETEKNNPFGSLDEIEVEDGKIFTKKVWCFEIEDKSKVPQEYMCVDTDAIDNFVREGMRNIPGIKIFVKEETALRVKN